MNSSENEQNEAEWSVGIAQGESVIRGWNKVFKYEPA